MKGCGGMMPSCLPLILLAMCCVIATRAEAGAIHYDCGNGFVFSARFSQDAGTVDLHLPGGQTLTLPQLPAASGFSYGDTGHQLRGKGSEVTLAVGQKAPRKCRETTTAMPVAGQPLSAIDQCLLDTMKTLPATATLAQVRDLCTSLPASPAAAAPVTQSNPIAATTPAEEQRAGDVSHRLAREWQAYDNPFALTMNKPSYFILGYQFSDPNTSPYEQFKPDDQPDLQEYEAKFQISLKLPLLLDLFGSDVDIMAAYTNRSFWQVFNHELSAPFRETNHEPEAWFRWRADYDLLGGKIRVLNLGINHQSNGQSGTLSRSWNRVFAEVLYQHGPIALNTRVWNRLDESADQDDNPDIADYMGNCELTAIYQMGQSEWSAMFRLNPDTGYGAYQIDWSYPLYKNLRGYVQWFEGYGESLIDYNYKTTTLGAGVQIGGWL